MVRLAVLSDIHANALAFAAVLRDLDRREIDRIVCLGDLVGYSSQPRQVLQEIWRRGITSTQGNHDLMACGLSEPVRCGPNARRAIEWTRGFLDEKETQFLANLAVVDFIDDAIVLCHSTIEDPWIYLRTPPQFRYEKEKIQMLRPSVKLCLTGHTHTAGVTEVAESGQVRRSRARSTRIIEGCFWFVNPGSVGHPRGEDYRASYAILDTARSEVTLRKVPYDRTAVENDNHRCNIYTNLGPSVFKHRYLLARRMFGMLVSRLRLKRST